METLTIDILNPKAKKLLEDLEEMELIAIKRASWDKFFEVVEKLRAQNAPITLEEITEEVEAVRAERYANRNDSK
jgi:predicted nucleic acid-binding protein